MNSEDPYRQKTDHTRRRIDRRKIEETSNVTGLPPRSEIHQKQRKKSETKLNFPLIRLLVLFFILLPVTIFAVYTYRDTIFPTKSEPVIAENGGYETISIDNSDTDKKTSKSDDENKDSENAQKKANSEEDSKVTIESTESQPDEGQATDKPAENTNPATAQEVTSAVESATQPPAGNPSSGNKTANNVEIKQHTVQPGETLYRIAMKYYQSKSGIELIKEANQLKTNEIRVGQILTIPIEK